MWTARGIFLALLPPAPGSSHSLSPPEMTKGSAKEDTRAQRTMMTTRTVTGPVGGRVQLRSAPGRPDQGRQGAGLERTRTRAKSGDGSPGAFRQRWTSRRWGTRKASPGQRRQNTNLPHSPETGLSTVW